MYSTACLLGIIACQAVTHVVMANCHPLLVWPTTFLPAMMLPSLLRECVWRGLGGSWLVIGWQLVGG